MTNRRSFLAACSAAGLSATFANALWTSAEARVVPASPLETPNELVAAQPVEITVEMIRGAEAIVGVEYTDAQREQMLERLNADLVAYRNIRSVAIPNDVPSALRFSPLPPGRSPVPYRRPAGASAHSSPHVQRPATAAEIAFLPVIEQAALIRSRQLTSTELTRIYLDRIRRYNPELRAVLTPTIDLALRQAAGADQEIAAGKYRGVLHGIPYGLKDIFAVPGYPTTWGAEIFADRVIAEPSTVFRKLTAAGAVLVAKTSLGELGLSDRWFGGQTMNPWNTSKGSQGSSAGSAVSVSAGLMSFAIGAETMGSIVTPATRNGVTGLRPTFGRVSRHGSMVLSWSLDKIGPLAREVEDCAVILEAIAGADGKDPSAAAVPFEWHPERPLSGIRVGFFQWAFENDHPLKSHDDAALAALRRLGVQPVPIELPSNVPVNSLLIVRVEAAAVLDEVARAGGLDRLKVQDETGWPNFHRAGHFIPAVEYIQANRMRSMLMSSMDAIFQQVDVFMAPTFGVLALTNLTGHPCVVMPNGLDPDGMPTSISLIGKPYGESALCTVARRWQNATGHHRLRPPAFAH